MQISGSVVVAVYPLGQESTQELSCKIFPSQLVQVEVVVTQVKQSSVQSRH